MKVGKLTTWVHLDSNKRPFGVNVERQNHFSNRPSSLMASGEGDINFFRVVIVRLAFNIAVAYASDAADSNKRPST